MHARDTIMKTTSNGNQVITKDGGDDEDYTVRLIHDKYWEDRRWKGKFYLERPGKVHLIFSGEPNDADYNRIMSLKVKTLILALMRSMSTYLHDPPGYYELAKEQVEKWIIKLSTITVVEDNPQGGSLFSLRL